jgi:hypothetical protein
VGAGLPAFPRNLAHQPIYRKSVARWKAYEPYLATLFDRLKEPRTQ